MAFLLSAVEQNWISYCCLESSPVVRSLIDKQDQILKRRTHVAGTRFEYRIVPHNDPSSIPKRLTFAAVYTVGRLPTTTTIRQPATDLTVYLRCPDVL